MKTKIKILTIIILSMVFCSKLFSQSYVLQDPVLVPVYLWDYNVDDIDTRDYFWDITEINNNNDRLDVVVGLNQIQNATTNNYINANWYKNQYDDNFNEFNSSTKFINQFGYQYTIRYIYGLALAKINSSSGKKDVVVSQGDSMYVYKNNTSGSITTTYEQRFLFACSVQSSGRFTTDDVEDVAVLRNDSIFIFKGNGSTSTLDSVPAFIMAGASGSYTKILLAQVNSKIEPYATLQGTTSNRDEIIMRKDNSIFIFNNNNSNGISSITQINGFFIDVDFKIADVNNDGFNDLVTTSIDQGIKIYLNNEGSIDTNVDYSNNISLSNPLNIEVADFNKDGWNDIAVANLSSILIYLNTQNSSLFSNSFSYEKVYDLELFPLFGKKLKVVDLHNKGGLSLVFSGKTAVNIETTPYPSNLEWMYRFNPNTIDAVPAPAYLFGRDVQVVDSLYHPKLMLFNRGDRDFLKYRIYKKNYSNYVYFLFDSTSSSQYIDTTEDLIYTLAEPVDPPEINLNYFAVAVDNSYKVSINSDTIGYVAFAPFCPECPGGPDNIQAASKENIMPKEYSLSNYPNPFNPTTKIKYDLPREGNVKITIYNSVGQKVIELVNEFKQAGAYIAEFNGANLSSGIYFYRLVVSSSNPLESNGIVLTRRMLLIK